MVNALMLTAYLGLLICLFLVITVAVLERWDQEALQWAKSLFVDEPCPFPSRKPQAADAVAGEQKLAGAPSLWTAADDAALDATIRDLLQGYCPRDFHIVARNGGRDS